MSTVERSVEPTYPGENTTLWTRLRVRYRLSPWWARVTLVFLASRVVTTTILLAFASIQAKNPWTGAKPGYFDFASIWDGHWYYIIAVAGYPTQLPVNLDGHLGENAWAFLPGYPAIVRLVMLVTTLDFPYAAVLVSVAFSLGAALMFYRLLNLTLPAGTSLFAVVLFCVAPLSPILQVAYAEPMYLFLLTVALYLLVQRRYWTMLPVIAVMNLTRPGGLAFALTLGLHIVYRWWVRRRDPFTGRERIAALVVTAFAVFAGVAWILIAWALTGIPSAYTETELAWRSTYVGYQSLLPFTPWLLAAGFWAPWFGIPIWLLVAMVALILVVFALYLFTPSARRLGVDVRFWVASYMLYLLAVFFPQSSTFRILMPAFPVLGAVAQPKSRTYRVVLVLVCVLGQIGWVYIGWWVNGRDWTPP